MVRMWGLEAPEIKGFFGRDSTTLLLRGWGSLSAPHAGGSSCGGFVPLRPLVAGRAQTHLAPELVGAAAAEAGVSRYAFEQRGAVGKPQCARNTRSGSNADVRLAVLDVSPLAGIHAGGARGIVLRESCADPSGLHVRAERCPHGVHGREPCTSALRLNRRHISGTVA